MYCNRAQLLYYMTGYKNEFGVYNNY